MLFVTVAVAVAAWSTWPTAGGGRDSQRQGDRVAARPGPDRASAAPSTGDVLDHLTDQTTKAAARLLEQGQRPSMVVHFASGGVPVRPGRVSTLRFEVRPDLALEVNGRAADRHHGAAQAGYARHGVAPWARAKPRSGRQGEALAERLRIQTRAISGRRPRPAHPARLDQGERVEPAATDVSWSPRGRGRAAC